MVAHMISHMNIWRRPAHFPLNRFCKSGNLQIHDMRMIILHRFGNLQIQIYFLEVWEYRHDPHDRTKVSQVLKKSHHFDWNEHVRHES